MEQLMSWMNRVFFLVALALSGLAVLERIVNIQGYTLLRGAYTGGRLVEFAGVLLLYVIALELRQIKRSLAAKGGT